MAVDLRASDIRVDIRRDATPLGSLSINSGSFNPGITQDSYKTASKATSTIVQTVDDCVLSVDMNPQNPDYYTLLDIMRAKGDRQHPNHAEFRDAVIDAEFVADFGVDGRSRVLMSNCGVTDGNTSFQSGTARATQGLTFTAPAWRLRG